MLDSNCTVIPGIDINNEKLNYIARSKYLIRSVLKYLTPQDKEWCERIGFEDLSGIVTNLAFERGLLLGRQQFVTENLNKVKGRNKLN